MLQGAHALDAPLEPEAPAVAVPLPEVLASLRRELEEKTRALQAAVSSGGIRLAASVVEHASAQQPPPEQLQRLLGLRSGEVRCRAVGRPADAAARRRGTRHPNRRCTSSGCPSPADVDAPPARAGRAHSRGSRRAVAQVRAPHRGAARRANQRAPGAGKRAQVAARSQLPPLRRRLRPHCATAARI
jgi:hypothetical protein